MPAMQGRWASVGRLSSFVATTGFTQVVSLIAIPVIIAQAGALQWGIQGALQSTAGLFGVAVSFGWGTTGAAQTAAMPPEQRPAFFLHSLISRAYLFVVMFPVMVLVMGLINPQYVPLVVVGSAAYLMPFLGANWYFVGEGRPSRLFRYDVLPQSIGLALSVVVILSTSSLVWAVAAQLVCNLAGVILSARVIRRSDANPGPLDLSLRSAVARLGGQHHAVITAGTSALYVAAPMLVINVLRPEALPLYNMGDKLFRFALTAFTPVVQFVQSWIPEGGPEGRLHRIGLAARLTPVLGLIGAAGVALLGPFASRILSSSGVVLDLSVSTPFGMVFAAVACTQVLGLACLVQLGATKSLAISTVWGAVAGLPLIVVGALFFGVVGVAWAVAVSELVVLAYQARKVASLLRAADQTAHPGSDGEPTSQPSGDPA
ncbi:MAG: hypothetical protein WAZ15_04595 [Propioniciclava sp.]|uniref:lipopolysaccharide biosynthesis protein n=1 Tax=Propioniciclava sp. TaxID=2038686 RepID=UPI002D1FABCC|nr:hypothetical protein [Propioniciclava sp.]